MSDAITDAYEVERNINENNKEYINEIINAEFDKSKIVQRRFKEGNGNYIGQHGWHTFPKGEYNFNDFDYRVKDQNANISEEELNENLNLIGMVVNMNYSTRYHMITGYDSNTNEVIINGLSIKMEDLKKNYMISVRL